MRSWSSFRSLAATRRRRRDRDRRRSADPMRKGGPRCSRSGRAPGAARRRAGARARPARAPSSRQRRGLRHSCCERRPAIGPPLVLNLFADVSAGDRPRASRTRAPRAYIVGRARRGRTLEHRRADLGRRTRCRAAIVTAGVAFEVPPAGDGLVVVAERDATCRGRRAELARCSWRCRDRWRRAGAGRRWVDRRDRPARRSTRRPPAPESAAPAKSSRSSPTRSR